MTLFTRVVFRIGSSGNSRSFRRLYFLIFFSLPFIAQTTFAQDRCSIIRYEQLLNQQFPNREQSAEFEKWLNSKLKDKRTRLQQEAATYTIPIVVHIIHNGEQVGTGTNLSEAQIISQIQVLNKDFKRLNTDATQTPSDFQNVAGSISIEFVLAKRDPDGAATNGIRRVNGGKTSWGVGEEAAFKALSYWPAEDYFNIWVLNLSGSDIGYASFPVSNLPGLQGVPDNRITDGVMIDYKVFGSADDGAFSLDDRYNKGRTVTHEVGHFFGLRHIWGDAFNCATDYVEDTPPQSSETTGCPNHPQASCNSTKMFQNYMDYTYDRCMNLFTKGQVDRMKIVMENSPRRKSLLTSTGSFAPDYLNEAAIAIISPGTTLCPGLIVPQAEIKNLGKNNILSAKIKLSLNGSLVENKTFSLNLPTNASQLVNFSELSIPSGNASDFSFELVEVNGQADELVVNNVRSIQSITPFEASLPLTQPFNALPIDWAIVNQDNGKTWEFSETNNGSLLLSSFNYDVEGATDILLSPVFDATGVTNMLLQFEVAYAKYPGNETESLRVYILEDCGNVLNSGTIVFQKQGSALATAPDQLTGFVPTTGQWRTERISINAFGGKKNLRLAFAYQNGYGNNFYLDNIKVSSGLITDVAVESMVEPSLAVCTEKVSPRITIANYGTTQIDKIKLIVRSNNILISSDQRNLTLAPGGQSTVDLGEISLNAGTNDLQIEAQPIGTDDFTPIDNTGIFKITRITNKERIPTISDFDRTSDWIPVTGEGGKPWEITSTNQGNSAVFIGYGNSATGTESWLVSPILDMSRSNEGSMFADFSYGLSFSGTEKLTLTGSTDCGRTFGEIIFEGSADELNSNLSQNEWKPKSESDWQRQYFSLSPVAGRSTVLLALKVTNANGNNLYVDNIEFFIADNPEPLAIEEPFKVYTEEVTRVEKLTFNLEERQNVRLQLMSVSGKVVLDNILPDVLNQTYSFDLGLPSGIYIYRLQINGKFYALRHFVP